VTRGGHRSDGQGYCPRCALPTNANRGMCPPGFWMTEEEQRRWSSAGYVERQEMEIQLGSQMRVSANDSTRSSK
jgi:hypothetical protein